MTDSNLNQGDYFLYHRVSIKDDKIIETRWCDSEDVRLSNLYDKHHNHPYRWVEVTDPKVIADNPKSPPFYRRF